MRRQEGRSGKAKANGGKATEIGLKRDGGGDGGGVGCFLVQERECGRRVGRIRGENGVCMDARGRDGEGGISE